jgi:hypothetical protein
MIDQQQHVERLIADLRYCRAAERHAVALLASTVDDEQEFAGADAAHAAILGAVRDTAKELGKPYYEHHT